MRKNQNTPVDTTSTLFSFIIFSETMISFFHRTTRGTRVLRLFSSCLIKMITSVSVLFNSTQSPAFWVKRYPELSLLWKVSTVDVLIFFFHRCWEIQNSKTMIITFSLYLKKPNVSLFNISIFSDRIWSSHFCSCRFFINENSFIVKSHCFLNSKTILFLSSVFLLFLKNQKHKLN